MSMQIDHQEPEYLNLAHQFLDDNFIGVATNDSFSKLPLISSNLKSSIVDIEPPRAVDYFSASLTSEQYYRCWRSISNNRFMKPFELSNIFNLRSVQNFCQVEDLMLIMPCTSSVRLENACWRAWYKSMKNLPELDPSAINWYKENDITVLYGPLINDTRSSKLFDKEAGVSAVVEDDTVSDIISDYAVEDEIFDRHSLSRSNSLQSSSSSLTSVDSACTKSILKKKRRNSAQRKLGRKRVSFSNQVERREIVSGSVFDYRYMIKA